MNTFMTPADLFGGEKGLQDFLHMPQEETAFAERMSTLVGKSFNGKKVTSITFEEPEKRNGVACISLEGGGYFRVSLFGHSTALAVEHARTGKFLILEEWKMAPWVAVESGFLPITQEGMPVLTVPGGFTKPGESIIDSAKREVGKETAKYVVIGEPKFLGLSVPITNNALKHEFMFHVKVTEAEEEQTPESTISGMFWQTRDEVKHLLLANQIMHTPAALALWNAIQS